MAERRRFQLLLRELKEGIRIADQERVVDNAPLEEWQVAQRRRRGSRLRAVRRPADWIIHREGPIVEDFRWLQELWTGLFTLAGFCAGYAFNILAENRRWRHEKELRYHEERRGFYTTFLNLSHRAIAELDAVAREGADEEPETVDVAEHFGAYNELRMVAAPSVVVAARALSGRIQLALEAYHASEPWSEELADLIRRDIQEYIRVARQDLGVAALGNNVIDKRD